MTAPAGWPRAAVVAGLALTALLVVAQGLFLPGWTARVAPAALGLTTLAVALLVLRRGRSTGGRLRHQTVLDALIALAGLAVLLEVLVPLTVGSVDSATDLLIPV